MPTFSRVLVALFVAGLSAAILVPGCSTEGECGECVRAVFCVESCGAEPVQGGCCPCPEGSFDDIACAEDAGADGG